ncbi:hypothetical protein PanWU01x14_359860 [Parasponia andersonii]|uniref:Uncharacterized protein n=1 Tax=Parasponia andersonii TaxID=3476 RepID=A0A2P5A7V5_PARAD|nr:hypothetical protein PanWU01x14_359860 [Parasponia andersonii]
MDVVGGSGNVTEDLGKFCTNLSPLFEENHKLLASVMDELKASRINGYLDFPPPRLKARIALQGRGIVLALHYPQNMRCKACDLLINS